MPRTCMITGKQTARGNNVAHCNKKVRRDFKANLQTKRFFVPSENRWVVLTVSTQAMRTIDKHGIDVMLQKIRERGIKV